MLLALPEVFPWGRHLSAAEVREFAVDLVNAGRDAAELDVHSNLHRVIVERIRFPRAIPADSTGCVVHRGRRA